MKKDIKNKQSGFTLIELLVVISIIGTLAAISLASFSGTQKQARDSGRKSDIRQYQNSLEVFANQNTGSFPSRTSGSGVNASSTLCSDLGISGCPEDPRNSEDTSFTYYYQSNGSGSGAVDATNYVLWAKLEDEETTTYWVICSNGVVGKVTTGIPPVLGACPM